MVRDDTQAVGSDTPQYQDNRTPVLKGWLVTHEDGFEVRLGVDRGKAEVYLRKNRGISIEPMFVWR
jgi:hypothetical protein